MASASKQAALITGGASGIGLAAAKHFLGRGYRVIILDRNQPLGSAEAAKLGPDCLFLHVDLSDYKQQAQAFKRSFEWAGNRLDVFIANAGIADTDAIYKDAAQDDEGLPLPLDMKTFEVNLYAVIQGVRLFAFFARKSPQVAGKVIVTSSVVGVYPHHAVPLYASTKHALVGFVRSVAPVFGAENITINAILPAMIETGIMPEHLRPLWDPKGITPMKTAMRAYDNIIDDDSINGQTIELSLDETVFKQRPEYSTDNIRWVVAGTTHIWEQAAEVLMPRKVGSNAKNGS